MNAIGQIRTLLELQSSCRSHDLLVVREVMTRDPKNSPVPFWLYYFNVEDIDAADRRIKEKNGQVLMGPHQVPGDLWIILGMDPQGAMFSVVGPKKQ